MKTKNYLKSAFTMLFLLFSIASSFATNYYVDAINGNNINSGTSEALAKRTIQAAANLTNPGDTVFIMNGIYNPTGDSNSGFQSILTISRSGTAANYITYKNYPGHTPKLQLLTGLSYQVWRTIAIDASYIIIDGVEIEGTNQSLNYTDAYQTWQDYENNIKDWNKISMYNCGSISLGNTADVHHIEVRNCKIHDTGGGIGGFRCDYVTIENNVVYNTCWYSMYAGSGISILDPKSIDAVTGYKIYIRNNVVYNNKCLVPWERINALSDGNGIILDVNIGNGTTTFPYVGRYLVENNVSYNNGGGGVHAYKCAHVDIINNTAYNNGTNMGYPEIDAQQSTDIKIYNNIMYGRGAGANLNGNDAGAIYDYNIYFNGTSYKNGPNDKTIDPKFVNKALDASANFQLLNTSPAINNGNNISGLFASKDILGISRPVGFSSDMGAYEYGTVIPRAEMNIQEGATDITDNSGTFDFGSVSSTVPKDITFTIQNIGDAALNLTGTPKVVVTGTGFSLVTDAPAVVAANGSVTFTIKLTPVGAAANYVGTISIASNDADENPYNFTITGYGYDGTKALQTITFPAIPTKIIGVADFNAGATSDSGLIVTYTSSNTSVATIVSGQIRIIGAGTSNIKASQAGDAANNPAKDVTQLLTVTPVIPPAGTNLVTNPTFDANTTGWSFSYKNGATTTLENVIGTGYTTKVAKITVTNVGTSTGTDNVQFSYNKFFIEKGKTYIVSFTASADVARNINTVFIMNGSPYSQWALKSGIPLTTSPTNLGPYNFISTFTGYVDLRFHIGGSGSLNAPIYLNNVSVVEDGNLDVDEIEVATSQAPVVYVYPNPVGDLLSIDFDSETGQQVTVSIIDLHGQVLITTEQLAVYGENTIELNVSSLANGLYLIKTTENNINYNTVKVVVKH
ncbi:T9SS C-terminal target domain-containing protein [Flavobacterium cupreum]|uniref:Secreted protein (Por secretion system target) n=2 Tax=Flavobacterium TaxID=237 RepID=A0A4Y7UDZ1_9FLAO|nr:MULTISPECIES: T9SS type A sorting domain-containing protein [Flavobacterium]RUT67995.1 T9SS C-terminal target domain-containing protein [Flavobacterium cupreum]TCN59021.1 putative secreted protein (Por secretion system target) [Flavobacterium circumlabens]TEB44421.1 T9SS C-terminal target domain-containing protein [Flavobacterium circumlabens]